MSLIYQRVTTKCKKLLYYIIFNNREKKKIYIYINMHCPPEGAAASLHWTAFKSRDKFVLKDGICAMEIIIKSSLVWLLEV